MFKPEIKKVMLTDEFKSILEDFTHWATFNTCPDEDGNTQIQYFKDNWDELFEFYLVTSGYLDKDSLRIGGYVLRNDFNTIKSFFEVLIKLYEKDLIEKFEIRIKKEFLRRKELSIKEDFT